MEDYSAILSTRKNEMMPFAEMRMDDGSRDYRTK